MACSIGPPPVGPHPPVLCGWTDGAGPQPPASDVDTNPRWFIQSGSGRCQGPGTSPERTWGSLAKLGGSREAPRHREGTLFPADLGVQGEPTSSVGPRVGDGPAGICQKWGGASGDWPNGSGAAATQGGAKSGLLPPEKKLRWAGCGQPSSAVPETSWQAPWGVIREHLPLFL